MFQGRTPTDLNTGARGARNKQVSANACIHLQVRSMLNCIEVIYLILSARKKLNFPGREKRPHPKSSWFFILFNIQLKKISKHVNRKEQQQKENPTDDLDIMVIMLDR